MALFFGVCFFLYCQQTCCKLIISTGVLQLVPTSCNKYANDKLQQAGKIDNLQQVCGVIGCVVERKRDTCNPPCWIF